MSVIEAADVRTHFGKVRAVDGVSLSLADGATLGLVGESGSGKTTLARTLLGLTPATSGTIETAGVTVRGAGRAARKTLHRDAQMIYQDPHASLSPRLRVRALLTEPYRIHRVAEEDRWSVAELLDLVELPAEHAGKYPHELSGGQARRVSIARAIALRPRLLVADEPTAGLDVSAASAVLNLLRRLRSEIGLAYLMVTHNLDTVGYAADRIAVMYLGRIVEQGPVEQVLRRPAHPYTHALVRALPVPDPGARATAPPVAGEPPSPRNPPAGCHFHPRCPLATARCRTETPGLLNLGDERHAACLYAVDHLENPLA